MIDNDKDGKPPFLGRWNNVYIFVVAVLALTIIGIYLFSNYFS
jgi:hypothetical protein